MKKQTLFNVAEYIRLSREDGDKAESDSISNQRKLIADFLKGKDEFVVYDTYVDDGFTGLSFQRPSFMRMMDDIEDGNVNCVIVKDLSRFGRDYIETGRYLERYFPDNDVRFIAITDNIDSMKQAYDILLPIKNIFNEQYARDISKKVHASMKTKQKAGEFIGAFASYGYRKSPTDKNKLVIDEYAAGVVRRIFQMYISGYGKIRIAGVLNGEGIVCPSEYKKLNGENYCNNHKLESTSYWTYSTINRLLKNEVYAGNMVQGRKTQRMKGRQRSVDKEDWIIVEHTHEAIIDPDTWQKAQELLKRRTRELDLNSNVSVFAGFLKCGDCGRSLVKKGGNPGHGNDIIHYYCGTYVRSGREFCTPHAIPYSILEEIILNDLNTIIRNVDNLTELLKQNQAQENFLKQQNDKEKNRLKAELEKTGALRKAVYEDYREGLISKDEFVTYREDYVKKEELFTKQLEDMESRQKNKTADQLMENPWVKRLLTLRGIDRLDRDIVVEMVHEIRVYENHRIQIIYNFSDELAHLFSGTCESTGQKEVI
ncbi:MAG: recombinase family protein [Lachnospiraceae bacterium]|nr:recombinase family protein [Lachnospiraceae bacterium]